MNKNLKFLTGVTLFLCAFFMAPLQIWGAQVFDPDLDREIAAQEQVNEELQKKIQQYNETVSQKAKQARSLSNRLSSLRQDSEIAQQQIKLLELETKKIQRSLAAMDIEVLNISRQVETLVGELRTRIVNIYKYGAREELNLLLSAENAQEAVASAYLIGRLAKHDKLIIENLLGKASALEQTRREIDRSRSQLTEQTEELNSQREKYESSINQANATLSGVQKERQRAEAAAREIEQAQMEIGRTIADLMRKKQYRLQVSPPPATVNVNVEPKTEAAKTEVPNVEADDNEVAKAEVTKTEVTKTEVTKTEVTKTEEVKVYSSPDTSLGLGRGSLLDWPIRGAIASSYGPREHPVFKTKSFNSGIDISSSSGAPVHAAGPGEVLFEGWLRGFGQVVIIDHGRNISTVYAHLASTRVKERDVVQPGTVIGTVGNTGSIEGYNLHFEVRVGDSAKNPLDYLKKT